MKIKLISWLFAWLPLLVFSQPVKTISLAACYEAAKTQHPLRQQNAIYESLLSLKLEQLDLSKKPQIAWNARATFQSEAVQLNIPIPNIEPIDLPLLRGQTTLDATYTLYDGGIIEAQKNTERAGLAVQKQQVEVTLEQLEPQITQAFLSVLLLRQQILVMDNALQNFQTKIQQLDVAVANGVALKGSIEKLQVEVLKIENTQLEVRGNIRSALALLEGLTGLTFDENVTLELPELENFDFTKTGNFPEYRLFELQKQKILSAESLLTARQKPKVGAFVQAGVGYPNPLNFFDSGVSPFAVVGVQFSWNFWDWGSTDKERQTLSVSAQLLDNQRVVFEHNRSFLDKKWAADLEKMESLLAKDREIIALQGKILEEMDVQLQNGIITATDYVGQVNARTQAELQLQTHLLMITQIKVEFARHKGFL